MTTSTSHKSLFQRLIAWWSRPPKRDRSLVALLEAEAIGFTRGVTGLSLRDTTGIGASIYTTLHFLTEEGLVTSTEGLPSELRGGLPRYYYSLTPAGQKEAVAVSARAQTGS